MVLFIKRVRLALLIFCLVLMPAVFAFWVFYTQEIVRKSSFEFLMGKGTKKWRYVESKIDLEDVAFYKDLYDEHKDVLQNEQHTPTRIPKVIHFIWLGPKPFPTGSARNIHSWMKKHPAWVFKFWTDSDRGIPVEGMQRCSIQDLSFTHLGGLLEKTTNFGEQSDILRYEILFQEGGVYVDHDVECMASFDSLHEGVDFYVPLEKPHLVVGIDSHIFPGICLIGSRPLHPILKQTLENVRACWDQVEIDFAGHSALKVINRTFKSFVLATRKWIGQSSYIDLPLPASYLFASDLFSQKEVLSLRKKGFALGEHQWRAAWTEKKEGNQDSKILSRVKKENRRLQKKVVVLYASSGSLALLCSALFYSRWKMARR